MILTSLVLAEAAEACTCFGPPDVEAGLDAAKNVAIFKVRSVEKYAEGEKGYGYGGYKQAKLTVEKVFKGNLKVGQELTFKQGGGGDCVWTYSDQSVGVEYLYFLGDKPTRDKIWAAFICTRSNSVKFASADLLYLEKLAKVRGKTRLSGTLSQQIESSIEEVLPRYIPLSGRKVLIAGNGQNIELKTDPDGVFEIYDLPPGKYKITPEKVDGFKFSKKSADSVEVELREKDHTEEDFEFEIDNSIGGRLFDSNGLPSKNVCINLIPARGRKSKDFSEIDCTDSEGRFEFNKIAPGTYVIVVNEDGKITSLEPFGTFYYPGTTNREKAAEINVEAGDFIDDLIINAPQTAETITVSGVLLFEDGTPVVDTRVNFFEKSNPKPKEEYGTPDAAGSTDDKGRFSIKILKGQRGELFGTFSAYVGKFENCPKLDNLIREKNEKFVDFETPVVKIEADNDLSEIVLKFPFPACRKKVWK
jgi:hypothetical protein